ncbi:MAG: hypothetical protein WCL11_00630 [Verrucomicrobiota bacterium]
MMSAKLSNSLLISGVLDRVPAPPALIQQGLVRNSTSSPWVPRLFTSGIRKALLQSGKALFVDDPAKEVQQGEAKSVLAGLSAERVPDYELKGELTEEFHKAGNRSEVSYALQLSLVRSNMVVWEDTTEVSRLSK